MRVWCVVSVLFALALSGTGSLQAETTAQDGFAKLTRLAGQWRAQTPDGKIATASYKVVSNGSVLMEELRTPDGGSMFTMYHLDGKDLMLTHYCAGKNQPRMKADLAASGSDELRFKFLDVTNLPDQNAGHMRDVTVTFKDKTHMSQAWTSRNAGKDQTWVFQWERVAEE